jgi:hypothetical protein
MRTMGTFGKHASTKSLGLSASKRKSTGKLNISSRTSRHSRAAQKAGRTILSRWSSRDHMDEFEVPLNRSNATMSPRNATVGPPNPSICTTVTDLPPSIPRRGNATDLPPSIPKRIKSRSSRVQLINPANDYDDGIGEHGQRNAAFGKIDMAKSRRWDQKEICLDHPPSYNKSTSVSALNAFANISIKSKKPSSNNPLSINVAPTMLEVSPGVHARLRGAHETWTFLQRDFYLPTSCKGCSVELTCIKNLDYVLCPTCRIVSPIDGPPETRGGGLGLGFTVDDLRRWETGNKVFPSPSAA